MQQGLIYGRFLATNETNQRLAQVWLFISLLIFKRLIDFHIAWMLIIDEKFCHDVNIH
jgi:hypothetical protein